MIDDRGDADRAVALDAVQLADLEALGARVGAHAVARLVHPTADRDDAAEGAVAAGDGGHTLVVDAVLEVDDRAVVAHERGDEAGRPLGVVGLDRDEAEVERLLDRLHLVQVQGVDGNADVADQRAAETQAVLLHRFDVVDPVVDQRHVVAGSGEQTADHAADRARSDDSDAFGHDLAPSRQANGRPTGGRDADSFVLEPDLKFQQA